MKSNTTPWVDRNFSRFWSAIEAVVPDDSWMPHTIGPRRDRKGKVVVEELGCGHYGCVMPTDADDTVVKLTSDVAEAAFVRAAMEISDQEKGSTSKWVHGYWPEGIVQYKAIYQLADATHRRRPLFLIWRQEAFDLGFLVGPGSYGLAGARSTREGREMHEAAMYLQNTQVAAGFVREWVKKKGAAAYPDLVPESRMMQWAYQYAREHWEILERWSGSWHRLGKQDVDNVIRRLRGKERAAVALSFYAMAVEMMQHNNAVVSEVGTAMDFYLDHRIVLADVHLNNIGKVVQEDYTGLVTAITDPGHAVFLDGRYDKLDIEVLEPGRQRLAEVSL